VGTGPRAHSCTGFSSHKLVIKVSGTTGHPRIDIDAFVILAR
jgi:hypothetical protein